MSCKTQTTPSCLIPLPTAFSLPPPPLSKLLGRIAYPHGRLSLSVINAPDPTPILCPTWPSLDTALHPAVQVRNPNSASIPPSPSAVYLIWDTPSPSVLPPKHTLSASTPATSAFSEATAPPRGRPLSALPAPQSRTTLHQRLTRCERSWPAPAVPSPPLISRASCCSLWIKTRSLIVLSRWSGPCHLSRHHLLRLCTPGSVWNPTCACVIPDSHLNHTLLGEQGGLRSRRAPVPRCPHVGGPP